MDCPRCGSGEYVKDGIVKERQRYQCKHCKYRYTVQQRSNERSADVRQLAIDMYLEGLGFRAIGRLLKVSHTAVFGWIKNAGKTVECPPETEPIEVVEIDEMHTYVGQKKTIDGFGLRSIG
jgi:transposase-like protein